MKREIISKEKQKNWKKPALIVLIAVLALILVTALGIAIAGSYVLDKLGSAQPTGTISVIPPELEDFETDPPETDPTESTQESTVPTETETVPPETTQPPTTETTVPTEPPAPPTRPNFAWPEVERLQSDDVINILLIGQDSNKATGQRSRSDSMILLSLNKKANTITMTSFMRDLYVQIPGGYSDNRINASYRFGGAPLLDATIEKNFGVVIDGNVEVGFDQFATIINILGGVDVNLSAAEANHLNKLGYTTATPGMNHMHGSMALAYCRIRKIDSDHNRTERQRKVLGAIAESARNMSAAQMLELINKVLPYVYTDLSDSEVVACATSGLSILSSGGKIQSGKVPQGGQYYGSNIMGMQVLVPNLTACNQYLKSMIYGQ